MQPSCSEPALKGSRPCGCGHPAAARMRRARSLVKPSRQARPNAQGRSTSHSRRKKSDPYVNLLDRKRQFHYTSAQCQPRSTSPSHLPNPAKGLVRASSAGSAERCAASLSAASRLPAPCGAQPPRKPATTPPRRKIPAHRAPRLRPSLPLCGLGLRSRPRRPRSGRVRVQPGSHRPGSLICSPPVVTAPRQPAAPHVATRATCTSPRGLSPNSAPKPVRFSTPRSRTAIPRPCGWCSPRSPSTSIRSCRPKRGASRIPRQRFPTCCAG